MAKPLVSVIIVNWNGEKVLGDCLSSLSKMDYPNKEIIIVDNGSTDGTERSADIKNITNLGFAKANNQGYKLAKGKYILLLNNDTKVTPDFLTCLVNKMETDTTLGVIQPKLKIMDKPDHLDNCGSFLTRIGFLEHWGFGEKDGPMFSQEREIFSAKGACMLIRGIVIEKVGLFDEDFVSYFEESDFCWRGWLAGWRILYYPKAEIFHKVGFTIKRLDVGNINYHYYKNRITSLIKNLSFKNLLVILPVHLLISQGIAAIFLLKANLNSFLMIEKAIIWNIVNLYKIIKKRHGVQTLRMLGDDELFIRKELMHPINWKKFYGDFKRVEEDIKRKSIS